MGELINTKLVNSIEQLIVEARKRTVATVNTAMVYTYYEIGRMIVEDEQRGDYRAEYGKAIIKELAEKLTRKYGKGFSAQNLANMRQFYIVYSLSKPIFQTLSRKSDEVGNFDTPLLKKQEEQVKPIELKFTLSWSHYLKLMRIYYPFQQ